MQTFILLTKLTPEITKRIKERSEIGETWLEMVKNKCPEIRFLSHFALLGQYDFLDIYEAPDVKSAAKLSMISKANGALQAESLPAIPYKDFLELVSEV